mgnify:FL=1
MKRYSRIAIGIVGLIVSTGCYRMAIDAPPGADVQLGRADDRCDAQASMARVHYAFWGRTPIAGAKPSDAVAAAAAKGGVVRVEYTNEALDSFLRFVGDALTFGIYAGSQTVKVTRCADRPAPRVEAVDAAGGSATP